MNWILVLSILGGFSARAYECDTGELRRVKSSQLTAAASKKFREDYKRIQKLGKKSELEKLKFDFQFNSVSQYLLLNPNLNPALEDFTHYYTQGSKAFYLNRCRLIAILDKKGNFEYLLTRLNASCQPFEMVSFSTLNPYGKSPLRYKISPAFCRAQSPAKKAPASILESSLEALIRDPKDKVTRQGISRDCSFLKQSPAKAPKTKVIL